MTKQEKEIERLKDEDTRLTEKLKQVLLAVDTVKEMTAMCNIDKQNAEIERLKDDYAKLQELFAKYQIASDKEIIAQKKQAVREFAEKLKKYSYTDNCFTDGKWHRYVLVSDIDKLLKEYENGKQI